jgi:protein arginine N-methyltransferase 1
VCPVVSERFFRELTAWDEVGYGLDFAPARIMSLNNIYVRWFEARDLLDGGEAARSWDKVTFDRRNKTTRAGEASWCVSRETTIHGLALWWSAELVEGVALATGPLGPRTHWEQLYLPALAPMTVKAGQTFSARLRSTTSYDKGTNVTWSLSVGDAGGRELARQSLDLEKGFLP